MKKLDLYIIKKYFLTYFFVSLLFLFIAVVIDYTEKQKGIIDSEATVGETVLYFLTFIPNIFSLLAPLFLLIAVIFFTSKLAANSEIVSILGNGISFYRFLRPYFISALIVCLGLLFLHNWVVPELNKYRISYLNKYYHHLSPNEHGINITVHRDKNTEVIASLQNYSYRTRDGYYLSYERMVNNEMVYQLRSPRVKWLPDSGLWEVRNFEEWQLNDDKIGLVEGRNKTKDLGFSPDEFTRRIEVKETMNRQELKDFIRREQIRGSEKVPFYKVELYGRTSNAFAIIILTIIGATFASRKTRGGTGANLFIGLAISSLYIVFMRFTSTFATSADLPALIAVWIPNIVFGLVALILMRTANN